MLRLGAAPIGLASLDYNADLNTLVVHEGKAEARPAGLETQVGATPLDGLVLGGSLGIYVLNNWDWDNSDVETGWDRVSGNNVVLLAIARYYPMPKYGLSFQLGVGIARTNIKYERADPVNPLLCPPIFPDCIDDALRKIEVEDESAGFAFSADAGYEAWIANEWSLGGAVRFGYASTTGEKDEFDEELRYELWMTTIALVVTYH